jgi:hypothetical protein
MIPKGQVWTYVSTIEIQTAINDIIAPDEYQALWWGKQWVCLGFLLKQSP